MRLTLLIAAIIATTTALGCGGPFGLFPGGVLAGDVAGAPQSWRFAGSSGTAQLETRPEDPYSVNIAYTLVDENLYINAGGTETQWAKNISANPSVRLRLNGTVYSLRAERIQDADEIASFAAAWAGQSFFRQDPLGFDEVWLYKLVTP